MSSDPGKDPPKGGGGGRKGPRIKVKIPPKGKDGSKDPP